MFRPLGKEKTGKPDGAELFGGKGDIFTEEFVFEKSIIESYIMSNKGAVFEDVDYFILY